MINLNEPDHRPLFSLTVEEYKELNRSLLNETSSHQKFKEVQKELSDIIYIEEASELLGYTLTTIYTKVSRSELPVLTAGRPLTFSRKQLNDWIVKGRPTVAEMKAEESLRKNFR